MIKSETEAKKRWCPMVRCVEASDCKLHGPFNRYHSGSGINTIDGHQSLCIASDCMMWRWSDREASEGYCGLAGKPQDAIQPIENSDWTGPQCR